MHTGVKSFGCEKSTAQESPIQSWKWIVPLRGLRLEVGRGVADRESHLSSFSSDPNGRDDAAADADDKT